MFRKNNCLEHFWKHPSKTSMMESPFQVYLHAFLGLFQKSVIGHLNTSRNKYEIIAGFFQNLNIFLISESKLYDAFPDKQLHINGFKIFRCDRNSYTGGLIYVHKAIPCKPSKIPLFDLNIEIIGLKCHQIKRKWLFRKAQVACY